MYLIIKNCIINCNKITYINYLITIMDTIKYTTFHAGEHKDYAAQFLNNVLHYQEIENNKLFLINAGQNNTYEIVDVLDVNIQFNFKYNYMIDVEKEFSKYTNDIIIAFRHYDNAYNLYDICFMKCTNKLRNEILKNRNDNRMYLWNCKGCDPKWISSEMRQTKNFNTVYVDSKKIIRVKTIINEFVAKKEFYVNNGVPYKLSLLLEGPPCG